MPSSSSRRCCGRFDLAGMRAKRMHFGAQRAAATGERIERHRSGEIGGIQQMFQFDRARARRGEHLRRAVVQREAFLERQAQRRQARALQRFGTRDALALVERLAAAEQHDGQVRQRREIATGADGALLRHHRHHVAIEHRGQRLQRRHADARVAAHQRIDADRPASRAPRRPRTACPRRRRA